MGKVYNKPEYRELRRQLRHNATPAERELWKYLKGKQLDGYKFRRQYGVERYVIDFYCPKAKLGVELDGRHHGDPEVVEYDYVRAQDLKGASILILRFSNDKIFYDIHFVLEQIKTHLRQRSPSFARRGTQGVVE